MFYLVAFYRLSFKNFAMGLVFILAIISFMSGPIVMNVMEEKAVISVKDIPSYFLALARHFPPGGKDRLLRLPGVEEVVVLEEDHIAYKKKRIMERFNLSGDLFNGEHMGVKIIFQDGISEKAKRLIHHYFKKFMGEQNVTLGSIVQGEKRSVLWREWQRGGLICLAVLVCLCWLFSFFKIRRNIQKEAFLVGRFQRKERVALKIYLAGVLSFIPMAAIISHYISGPLYYWPFALLMGLLFLCMFFRSSYRWE